MSGPHFPLQTFLLQLPLCFHSFTIVTVAFTHFPPQGLCMCWSHLSRSPPGWLLSSFKPWLKRPLLQRPLLTPWRNADHSMCSHSLPLSPITHYHISLLYFLHYHLIKWTFSFMDLFGCLLPRSRGLKVMRLEFLPSWSKHFKEEILRD